MLVFVIPLKSKQVARSWDRICQLLDRSIKAICNQTSPEYRAIVVCHEKPHIEFEHPHVTYLEVDFLPPGEPTYEKKNTDKGRKILRGLTYAKQYNPSHAMIVDSDDCVSKHLAEWVAQHPHSNGWFIDRGYKYQDSNQLIYLKRKDFYTMCGTCNIIRFDLWGLPESAEYNRGYGYYKKYIDHAKMKNILAEQGKSIEPLPFAGAVYIIETGENNYYQNKENKFYQNRFLLHGNKGISGVVGEYTKLFNCRLLTQKHREEFYLFDAKNK